ncbi:hypothetical protein TNCV_1376301 [Trichonephila clavipes]|nr:hypothetical protein TNCV_1376301 [Trichonephila clavipes]
MLWISPRALEFSMIFFPSIYSHTTHYDGEIETIPLALHQLSARLSIPDKAVILSDSSSVLQALESNQDKKKFPSPGLHVATEQNSKKVVFQWVPSHCGLWGNEMADLLAKSGMDILQISTRDLPLNSAKLEINRIYKIMLSKCYYQHCQK